MYYNGPFVVIKRNPPRSIRSANSLWFRGLIVDGQDRTADHFAMSRSQRRSGSSILHVLWLVAKRQGHLVRNADEHTISDIHLYMLLIAFCQHPI